MVAKARTLLCAPPTASSRALQVRKAERKLPWLKFADAQEKLKRSKEMLEVAQRRLAEVRAEVAQSVEPLQCALLTMQHPALHDIVNRTEEGPAASLCRAALRLTCALLTLPASVSVVGAA